MIKSLSLVNWRSHENTKMEFGYGTNLLVGIMGSGKTAVLDGISFALFGTFPALERRRLKLEDILRYGSAYSKVGISFSWNGSDYLVERKIERKNGKMFSKADIYKDNTHLESGATAVTELIEEVLGVDYDLFTRAIYSEQNNIDYFLSLDPKRRKEEFDRILGLDRFEKARAATVSITNRLESVARSLMERYSEEREREVADGIKALAEKERKLSGELALAEKAAAEAKRVVAELAARFEILEKNRRMLEALSRELASLQGQAASLEKGLAKVKPEAYTAKKQAIAELRHKKAGAEKTISELKKKDVEINKKLAVVESRIREQEQRLLRLEKLRSMKGALLEGKDEAGVKKELEARRKELEEKGQEKAAILQFVAQTEDMLKHLSPAASACPLCETVLGVDGIAKVRKKKEAEMAKAKERMKALAARIEILQKESTKLDEILRKAELLEQQIKSERQQLIDKTGLEQERATLKAEAEETAKKTGILENESREMQDIVERELVELNKMEEMLRREKMAAEIRKRIVEIEEKQRKIEYNEEDYLSGRKALEEKKVEEQKLRTKLEYLQKEGALLGENKTALEAQLLDMISIKNKAGATKEVVEELKIYKNALAETQVSLRRELIDAINTAMNEIWDIFYPYGNYKALRVDVTEKDYVFEVLESGQWKPLESIASGGERACAALTLRVALAMVLTPNLSWLILDEPTHNLDSQAIALLSETLQVKVPQVVKQIFVITHEEALIGADFSRTYKLSRDKNAGGATKAEML